MKWKIVAGPILGPATGWSRSHALLPTPIVHQDRLEVLAAALDERNFGRPFSVSLRFDDWSIIEHRQEPLLELGPEGSFDDCGVVPSCVVRDGDRWILYYLGFQRTERVPYMIFSGAAVSTDGMRWQKTQVTPILDRTATEPFSRGAPFVFRRADSWECFYWSCWGWTWDDQKIHYNNHIHRSVSAESLSWSMASHRVLECSTAREFSVGRPWVIEVDGVFHMFLSTRSLDRPYRLGYAVSRDLVSWTRADVELGISPDPTTPWASDMVCYSSLFEREGRLFMLFNGNGHGRTGFGIAELEGGRETLRETARRVISP